MEHQNCLFFDRCIFELAFSSTTGTVASKTNSTFLQDQSPYFQIAKVNIFFRMISLSNDTQDLRLLGKTTLCSEKINVYLKTIIF